MILAILQARTSSTRLPGKVLLPLDGEPMIIRQIERIRKSWRIDKLVLATSDDPSDNLLAYVVESAGTEVFRGSLDNVLLRYVDAALLHGPADYIVRLTGDCPLIEPDVIDAVVSTCMLESADYCSNVWPRRTFPKGLDVECMKLATLLAAANRASTPMESEHVTWGIYNGPYPYKLVGVAQPVDESHLCCCVDTAEDYEHVKQLWERQRHADSRSGHWPRAPALRHMRVVREP